MGTVLINTECSGTRSISLKRPDEERNNVLTAPEDYKRILEGQPKQRNGGRDNNAADH